jgi:hypothetical protein
MKTTTSGIGGADAVTEANLATMRTFEVCLGRVALRMLPDGER